MVYAVLVYLAIGLVCAIKRVITTGYSKDIKDARERKLSYAIPVVCAVLTAILEVSIWPFVILDRLIGKIYRKFYEKIHPRKFPKLNYTHDPSGSRIETVWLVENRSCDTDLFADEALRDFNSKVLDEPLIFAKQKDAIDFIRNATELELDNIEDTGSYPSKYSPSGRGVIPYRQSYTETDYYIYHVEPIMY